MAPNLRLRRPHRFCRAHVAGSLSRADNDPLNKTDPLGLRPQDCELVLGAHCGLDGAKESAAIFGDLEHSKFVAIYVSATGQNVTNFTTHPGVLWAEATKQAAGGSPNLAVLAWLGLDVPDCQLEGTGGLVACAAEVATSFASRDEIQELSGLVRELQKRGKVVTLIGHSWAAGPVSDATITLSHPENIVFVGPHRPSAGGHATDLNADRIWWGCNDDDNLCRPGLFHGTYFSNIRRFATDTDGHGYFVKGTKTIRNIALISSGRYAAVEMYE